MTKFPTTMRILIDPLLLAAALPSGSPDHWLIEELLEEQFDLCVSDETLSDYEKTLTTKYSPAIAKNFLLALNILPNVFYTRIHYRWPQLPVPPHYNHWIDTYTAAGADYWLIQVPDAGPQGPSADALPPDPGPETRDVDALAPDNNAQTPSADAQPPDADALKTLSFPAINVITLPELKDLLQGWK